MLIRKDSTIAHCDHSIGICGDIWFVGYHYYGDALLAIESANDFHDLMGGARIEVAGRLVGKQYSGMVDERQGQRDALLLSPGELIGHVTRAVCQTDARKHVAAAIVPLACSQ